MSLCEDFRANKNNTKGLFFIFLFRVSNFFTKNLILKFVGFPIRLFYKLFVEWILGIEIPDTTEIGSGFKIIHGQGSVINCKAQIGKNVTMRHNTTIGNSKSGGKSPTIENDVEIGANCVIIGNIIIGHHSVIGAGSVVIKSIPPYSVAVGNPARIIRSTYEN